MWVDGLVDARSLGSLAASQPHDVGRDGHVGADAFDGTGKEIDFGLHPAPVHAQGLQQLGTEWNIAIASTLALVNADHHALAVDIADLEAHSSLRRMAVEYRVMSRVR